MGIYLNPSAAGFADILKGGLYVDKTGLLVYTNQVMETSRKLTCFSRPRRFGKSFAAQMLAAFYSKGADSRQLFESLRVANPPEETREQERAACEKYGNQCDVVFWDMAWFVSNAGKMKDTVDDLQQGIMKELRKEFPGCLEEDLSLPEALLTIHVQTGRRFFVIIDEWDVLFREAKYDTELLNAYLQLLRGLFKGIQASRFLLGAYMTGILPIKKYGTQSALTDFWEYTMLEPGPLAEYAGFTMEEVEALCQRHQMDFEEMCRWYDGYGSNVGHICSPNSVMKAIMNRRFSDYWTQTETYESLQVYVDMNFDGLRDGIIDMLGGGRCRIDTGAFQNDMISMKSRDDVFTLLVHLGYLSYDWESRQVYIPNEEIREEFIRGMKHGRRTQLVKAIQLSDRLLEATLRMDEDAVAEMISEAHMAETSPRNYIDEQALRSVVLTAYLSCVDHYARFEELAGGRGYLDIFFLPGKTSHKPALLMELKWNKSARKAISQIEDKEYVRIARRFGYEGEMLLVGINYSVKTKKHTCKIIRYDRQAKKDHVSY